MSISVDGQNGGVNVSRRRVGFSRGQSVDAHRCGVASRRQSELSGPRIVDAHRCSVDAGRCGVTLRRHSVDACRRSVDADRRTVTVNRRSVDGRRCAIDARRCPVQNRRVNDTAERIRRLIETRGMSARSLSEAAGLSHSTVSSLLTKLDANPDARVEARTLALLLAAPESLLRRMRATGDLSAVRLAAETGMPWWAAALRLDMTVVIL